MLVFVVLFFKAFFSLFRCEGSLKRRLSGIISRRLLKNANQLVITVGGIGQLRKRREKNRRHRSRKATTFGTSLRVHLNAQSHRQIFGTKIRPPRRRNERQRLAGISIKAVEIVADAATRGAENLLPVPKSAPPQKKPRTKGPWLRYHLFFECWSSPGLRFLHLPLLEFSRPLCLQRSHVGYFS